jgi:hypothetical protein
VTVSQFTATLLLVVSALPLRLDAAPKKVSGNLVVDPSEQTLELTTTGQVRLFAGRRGILRVYTASDGTEGSVVYGRFGTLQDANHQIGEWLKLAKKVTKREKNGTNGQIVAERIVATAQDAKSGRKGFMVIRRNNLDCYLIQSLSLPVAIQVESMIENK